MSDEGLSYTERGRGWRRFMVFAMFNGFSFSLLGDNVLVLYALKAGVSVPMTAALGSFVYLAMPFLLFGKWIMCRFGASKTLSTAWIVRNMFGLLMAAAPLAVIFSDGPQWTRWLIIGGALGFYACRAIGVVAFQPLMGEITRANDRGRFLGGIGMCTNGAILAAMALFAAVIHLVPRLPAFQGLVVLGCVAGLVSAFIIITVPETDEPKRSANVPLLKSLKIMWNEPILRKMLYGNVAILSLTTLVVPVSTMALKRGYDVSEFTAVAFVFVQILGGLFISYVCGVIGDRIGPRPVVVISGVGLLVCALLWIVAPPVFFLVHVLALFIFLGFAKAAVQLEITHYFLAATKEEHRVGVGMLTQIISGACAGLAGSVVAGTLLKTLELWRFDPLTIYRLYFLIIGVIGLPLLWAVVRMEPVRDWKIRSVLGLLISPRDLYALFTLYRLEKASTRDDERDGATRLQSIGSDLGEEALLRFLESPDFTVRSRALNALRAIHLSQRASDALIREIRGNVHTTAFMAADILGEQQATEAIPELRRALTSPDLYLAGKCMVALARLNDEESFSRIRDIFSSSDNPRLVIHGAAAIAEMDEIADVRLLLRKAMDERLPELIRKEILQWAATLAEHGDDCYQFQKHCRDNQKEAIQTLLEEEDAPSEIETLRGFANGTATSEKALEALRDLAANSTEPSGPALKRFLDLDLKPEALNPELACVLRLLA